MSRRGKQTHRPPGSLSVTSVATDSVTERQRQQAFGRYVEPEIPALLRVAQTLTGSRADAEDLVQDTWPAPTAASIASTVRIPGPGG